MNIDFEKLLYTLLIAVIGFFLRDAYNWLKSKFFKGDRPKITFTYSYRHRGTQGGSPRLYNFEGTLIINNIDKESIYDLSLPMTFNIADRVSFENQDNPEIVELASLPPNRPIEIKLYKQVQHQETGSSLVKAKALLPKSFTNPDLTLTFNNYQNKKFKLKL
ncbi:MAG: hypothetical protein ACQETL_04830 [Bacteroidota bacterium]